MLMRISAASVFLRRKTSLALVFFVAICIPAYAQTAAPIPASPAPPELRYEVISIRPNNSADQHSSVRHTPNGIVYTNAPMGWLVRHAFGIITDDQLVGLPGWVDSDHYDIQAKMDDATTARFKDLPRSDGGRQQEMLLQSVLVERCQLKFHRETRQLPSYNLVIAKGGLKFKESVEGQGGRTMTRPGQFDGQGSTIGGLIYSLSGEVGRVVIDKTGLGEKKFDILLKWTPEAQQGTADAGPSIFTALEEQLGLKLVSTKRPVDVVVIDRIVKPEAN